MKEKKMQFNEAMNRQTAYLFLLLCPNWSEPLYYVTGATNPQMNALIILITPLAKPVL